jgi:purine nucleoside phosphorylase
MIRMTSAPEAFLARGEICYAVMAHVTDYDVWHSAGDCHGRDRCPNAGEECRPGTIGDSTVA